MLKALALLLFGFSGVAWAQSPQMLSPEVVAGLMPERIARFNRGLESTSPDLRLSPLLMALQWVGADHHGRRFIASSSTPLENPTQVIVVVTDMDQLDDSINAARTQLLFLRSQGRWKLSKVDETFRCARGADQVHFRKQLCP